MYANCLPLVYIFARLRIRTRRPNGMRAFLTFNKEQPMSIDTEKKRKDIVVPQSVRASTFNPMQTVQDRKFYDDLIKTRARYHRLLKSLQDNGPFILETVLDRTGLSLRKLSYEVGLSYQYLGQIRHRERPMTVDLYVKIMELFVL